MRHLLLLLAIFTVTGLAAFNGLADPVKPYVIGIDDVLEITVTNHEDLNKTVTVQGDGTITFPEVGNITASGKTPLQLADIIKTSLEKTRNKVTVLVSPKEIHSLRVRVLGAVKNPGQFDMKSDWRLMDLIDSAGGLNQKPSRISGRIVRNRTEVIPVDVAKADIQRNSTFNMPLMRDDLVLLDEIEIAHSQVIVMGFVVKPGLYDLDEHLTILSLLTQAGGPSDRAALSKAYVTRDEKQIPLNLTGILKGKFDSKVSDFKLMPGDVLYIPESLTRIAVMGEVSKPGYYPLPETGDLTVVDALNLAGGSTTGNTGKAGIIRNISGKNTVIPVDIDTMLKKGDLKKNVALLPNDVLYIPAKSGRKFSWSDLLGPMTALSFFGLHF